MDFATLDMENRDPNDINNHLKVIYLFFYFLKAVNFLLYNSCSSFNFLLFNIYKRVIQIKQYSLNTVITKTSQNVFFVKLSDIIADLKVLHCKRHASS